MADTKEPEVLPEEPSSPPGLDPLEVLGIIWAKRKIILILSFGVSLLTLGILLLQPNYYKAVSTILPETEKSKLSALGQFADIAQLAGVNVPGSEIARLYPTIVSSEAILRNVILRKYHSNKYADSVNLIKYFELEEATPEKNMATALQKMRGLISSSFDNKTSIVTVTMEMEEPQLAADVLNAVVGELDNFMRHKRITNASEQVKWIDVRLTEVEPDLRTAEEKLKDFREKNRRVSDSPELLLEQERLARDVQMKSTIYVELKKQYELAKLEEIKNITIVNILDVARPPMRKDRPKRATNTALMFLLTFLGASGYYTVRASYGDKIKAFFAFARLNKK
jgi:tyrosine-protein kinase Etk/Wzc